MVYFIINKDLTVLRWKITTVPLKWTNRSLN